MKDNNNKDEEKLKEELKKLIAKEKAKKERFYFFFMYGLHPNFSLHILLTIIINITLFSVIQGLTNFAHISSYGVYFLAIILFTFLEIIIKALITKLLATYKMYSLGSVDILLVLLLFSLLNYIS